MPFYFKILFTVICKFICCDLNRSHIHEDHLLLWCISRFMNSFRSHFPNNCMKTRSQFRFVLVIVFYVFQGNFDVRFHHRNSVKIYYVIWGAVVASAWNSSLIIYPSIDNVLFHDVFFFLSFVLLFWEWYWLEFRIDNLQIFFLKIFQTFFFLTLTFVHCCCFRENFISISIHAFQQSSFNHHIQNDIWHSWYFLLLLLLFPILLWTVFQAPLCLTYVVFP